VWRGTFRNDRHLFYNGNLSRWVIDDDVTNGPVLIQSKLKGLVNIPSTSWQYHAHGLKEDNTLRVIDTRKLIAENLLETEKEILKKYAVLKRWGRKAIEFENNYFPAFSRAKSHLRETRQDLRRLAQRTLSEVRDLKIVLEDLVACNDSVIFTIFSNRMKDLRVESLQEAREKYESAVKTFENTNSFAKTELFHTSFVETGQNFDRAIKAANQFLNDEIDQISTWTQRVKIVHRNIDNSPKEILSLLEPVRNIFLDGLNDLKNVADKFLAQPEVIINLNFNY